MAINIAPQNDYLIIKHEDLEVQSSGIIITDTRESIGTYRVVRSNIEELNGAIVVADLKDAAHFQVAGEKFVGIKENAIMGILS